ncbi:hypothetical protein D3C71_963260 [compost metagenome]
MRDIGDKMLLGIKGVLEAVEHRIECAGQFGKLVFISATRKPGIQTCRRNGFYTLCHFQDRLKDLFGKEYSCCIDQKYRQNENQKNGR